MADTQEVVAAPEKKVLTSTAKAARTEVAAETGGSPAALADDRDTLTEADLVNLIAEANSPGVTKDRAEEIAGRLANAGAGAKVSPDVINAAAGGAMAAQAAAGIAAAAEAARKQGEQQREGGQTRNEGSADAPSVPVRETAAAPEQGASEPVVAAKASEFKTPAPVAERVDDVPVKAEQPAAKAAPAPSQPLESAPASRADLGEMPIPQPKTAAQAILEKAAQAANPAAKPAARGR